MVTLKTNPVGVDQPIQTVQELLEEHLLNAWGLNPEQLIIYGRAYRNQSENDGDFVPEVFVGNAGGPAGKNEYKDAYYSDKYAAIMFFTDPTQTTTSMRDGESSTDISLIVAVDLSRLPAIGHRGDEEARLTLVKWFFDGRFGFNLTGIVTGLDNVLREYPGYTRRRGVPFRDMHPYHYFRLNFSLTYNASNCFTNLFISNN